MGPSDSLHGVPACRTRAVRWWPAFAGGLLLFAFTPAAADTWEDSLVYAYQYNPDLAAARAHLRGVDEQVPQALAGWRPTVTLNGSAGYQDFGTGTSYLLQTPLAYKQETYGGNLQFKQPIYSSGRTAADVARAEATVRAARADLAGTEQTVLLRAATAYADVRRSRTLLALDRQVEGLLRRQVHEITLRQQAGQLTQTDIEQASSQLAGAVAARISAEGDLFAANARFVSAIGRPPATTLAEHDVLAHLPKNAAEAMKLAEASSPTVIASLLRMEAAEHAVAVARAALLPNLSLSAQAGADKGQTVPTARSESWNVTLNLSVPIYQGGAEASQVRQATYSALEAKLQTQSSRRDSRENAETSFATWRAAVDRLAQLQTQVKLAEAAYDGVQREAAVGAKSTFELLGQLQDLFNARSNEVQGRYGVAVDAFQLLVAVGQFTAADLRLRTPVYDPVASHDKAAPLP